MASTKLWFDAKWFFLWGIVKDYVFSQSPTSFANLAWLIMKAIRTINQKMVKKVFLSMKRQVKVCCANAGNHVDIYCRFDTK